MPNKRNAETQRKQTPQLKKIRSAIHRFPLRIKSFWISSTWFGASTKTASKWVWPENSDAPRDGIGAKRHKEQMSHQMMDFQMGKSCKNCPLLFKQIGGCWHFIQIKCKLSIEPMSFQSNHVHIYTIYIVEMESIGLELASTSHVALEHHIQIPYIYICSNILRSAYP